MAGQYSPTVNSNAHCPTSAAENPPRHTGSSSAAAAAAKTAATIVSGCAAGCTSRYTAVPAILATMKAAKTRPYWMWVPGGLRSLSDGVQMNTKMYRALSYSAEASPTRSSLRSAAISSVALDSDPSIDRTSNPAATPGGAAP